MKANDTHVTTSVEFLESVDAARSLLDELYLQQRHNGHRNEQLGAKIAETHQLVGYGFKMAQIHANLAQAVALEEIRDVLRRELAPKGELL